MSAMPANRTSFLLYLAPLVLGPVLILAIAFVVVPTEWASHLGGDYWLIGLGYGARLHHADCQVVIFGDSTGMVAVNPEQLTAQTGLSACNIAETEAVQVVNGQAVLDRYLAQNAPPKVLVMMQAPDSFNPREIKGHGIGEGITYLMSQPDAGPKIHYALTHAPDLLRWASANLDSILRNFKVHHFTPEQMTVRDRTRGQLLLNDSHATVCPAAQPHVQPDRAWIESIRTRYGTGGTRVIVDASAVPDCDPDLAHYRSSLQGVIDNHVETLPLNDFYIGGRHVDANGSKAVTSMIAAQICGLELTKACGVN